MSRSTKRPYFQLQGHKKLKKNCSRMERRFVRQTLSKWRYAWRDCHLSDCNYVCVTADYPSEDDWWPICKIPCPELAMDVEPVLPIRKYEVMSPYDICDYRGYYPEDPKSYRK